MLLTTVEMVYSIFRRKNVKSDKVNIHQGFEVYCRRPRLEKMRQHGSGAAGKFWASQGLAHNFPVIFGKSTGKAVACTSKATTGVFKIELPLFIDQCHSNN